jgi:hypothetical protein
MPAYERVDPSRAEWLMVPTCALKYIEDLAPSAADGRNMRICGKLDGYFDAIEHCLGHDAFTLLRAYGTVCKSMIDATALL